MISFDKDVIDVLPAVIDYILELVSLYCIRLYDIKVNRTICLLGFFLIVITFFITISLVASH